MIHMKCRLFFLWKIIKKNFECRLLQILLGALRVNVSESKQTSQDCYALHIPMVNTVDLWGAKEHFASFSVKTTDVCLCTEILQITIPVRRMMHCSNIIRLSWKLCLFYSFYITFNIFHSYCSSVWMWQWAQCLLLRVLPHWNIMTQTHNLIFHPILTLGWAN